MAGHNDADSNAITKYVALIATTILFVMVIWFVAHTQISLFVLNLAQWVLRLLAALLELSKGNEIAEGIISLIVPKDVAAGIDNLIDMAQRQSPKRLTFVRLLDWLEVIGLVIRLVLPLMLIWSLTTIWRHTKPARLKRRFDIISLAKWSMRYNPQIRPAIIANLLEVDPDKGSHRREVSPIRFAIMHSLISAYSVDLRGKLEFPIVLPTFDRRLKGNKNSELVVDKLNKNGIARLHNRCILDNDKVEKIFINQLGPLWRESSRLSACVRSLYAAFITFAQGGEACKDTAMKLLMQMNQTWQAPEKRLFRPDKPWQIDTKGAEELIALYEHTAIVQAVISAHAYETTVMQALLQLAREKGKMACAWFYWLKLVDRTLWYSLHQEGGNCGWTEAAGPRAHKLAEDDAKGAIYQPVVEEGVLAFYDFLAETEGWIPKESEVPTPQSIDQNQHKIPVKRAL